MGLTKRYLSKGMIVENFLKGNNIDKLLNVDVAIAIDNFSSTIVHMSSHSKTNEEINLFIKEHQLE